MPYFLYILQAEDGTYYVGQTSDLEDRIARHCAGRVPSTKSRSGWQLVHREGYSSRAEALARERQIKAQKSRAYIEQLVRTSRA